MAPKNWRRPLTLIYKDNIKYGADLYTPAIDEIEKRYTSSMSRTSFRADRPDVNCESFSTNIGISASPGALARSTSGTGLQSSASAFDLPSRLQRTTSIRNRPSSMIESDMLLNSTDNSLKRVRSMVDMTTRAAMRSALNSSDDIDDSLGFGEDMYMRRRSRRRRDRNDAILASPSLPPSGLSMLSGTTGLTSASQHAAAGMTADYYYDKCRELRNELESLSQKLIDTETKVKTDANTLRNKVTVEMQELSLQLDEAQKQNDEYQKMMKKQSKQIMDLTIFTEDLQRHLQDIIEELTISQKRCGDLQNEVDSLKSSLETGGQHHLKTWRFHERL